MPTQDEYPKSVVLHFSPSVYQKIGAAEMIPKLLEIFNVEDLRCLQFLRNGKIRVSFREKEVRDHYLVEGMRFGGVSVGRGSWVVGPKSWVVGSKSWVVGSKSWVVGRGLLIGRDLY